MSLNKTVLIVEDDPVFRRVLSFSIAKIGMTVETANHGASGFDRLMAGGIDFLVTDLQMPLCSGIELLERLQAVAGYQSPSTVLCTAKGLELDRDELISRFGLLAVMHKPFSPRKLTEIITNHFQASDQANATTSDARLAALPATLTAAPVPIATAPIASTPITSAPIATMNFQLETGQHG